MPAPPSNTLTTAQTAWTFRTAIRDLGYVKGLIVKLADADRTSYDTVYDLDNAINDLETDLETYQDLYRDPPERTA